MIPLTARQALSDRVVRVTATMRPTDLAESGQEAGLYAVCDEEDGNFLGLVPVQVSTRFPNRIFADLLPRSSLVPVAAESPPEVVYQRMATEGVGALPVLDEQGAFLGAITRLSLLEALLRREQLLLAHARELAERKRVEAELQARARQQAVVAELGQRALVGTDLTTLMKEAVALIAQTIDVEYCKVLELLPDGTALRLRAGVGWKEGSVGEATVGAGTDSQAGWTLLSNKPVIVEDLRTETRFSGPPLLINHGVVSGMSVIIRGKERPFGVLGAHTTRRRTFTQDDIHFLQAIANVLATAIERIRMEEALRRSDRYFRSIIGNTSDIIQVMNDEGTLHYISPSVERVLGYKPEEVIGKNAFEFVHPEDSPDAMKDFAKAIEHPAVAPSRELRIRHKDGSWRIFEGIAMNLLHDPDVGGVVINSRDITERKRAQEEQQRLYQEAERRQQQAEAFATLILDLAASLELDTVLERLVTKAKELSQADLAFLALVEKEGQSLTIRAQAGASSSLLQGLNLLRGCGMAGQVLSTGEPLVTEDYLQDPRFSHEYDAVARAGGIVAQAAVPIVHEGPPLGVLLVARRTPRPFTPADLEVLTHLADAASLSCHHALFYHQATSRAAALERLWQVGQALNQSLALPETLDRIVQAARELLQADFARLGLWDEAAQCLTFVARAGGEALPRREAIHLGEGVIGTVAAARRSLIVNDYQAFPHRFPELPTITAIISVPLLVEERLIGVLNVGATEPGRAFTAEDLQLLELLVQPAAIALERARLYQELVTYRDQLRALMTRIQKAKEEEAKRIAHVLHDEAGQLLASIHIALEQAASSLPPPVRERLQEVRGLLDQVESHLRHLSHELRPTILDDLGLFPALQFLAQGISTRTELAITVKGSTGGRLSSAIETAFYRIVQEALTNVTKHAKATRVRIQLEREDTRVHCSIQDDGIGFDVPAVLARRGDRGLGLIGIHERINALGGTLHLTSAPGRGTELRVTIPLEDPAAT
ncbi:MAG: GAF domain-containing protein [candidate division NC10 bacterium]|nr:GAF domain-containing protein [candidate division NC10 bacterium]